MMERFEVAQKVIDDLDLRALASKVLAEATRLALRHAKRSGKRDVDQARIDDLLTRFVAELQRERSFTQR
jgi:hypothetical protein